jgi:hypothetical protein
MIGARFVVMTLLVFAAGAWSRLFRDVRELRADAQAAVWFATGLVTLTVEMLLLTAIGVKWNVLALLVLPVALAIPRLRGVAVYRPSRHHLALMIVALLALIVFATVVLSAAATSGDFVFFWGTKGQRFAQQRMLDTAFLRDPNHVVMHPEYPPLVPMYYAWTMLGGEELDWFGAMSSAIAFLVLATAAVSGFARSDGLASLFASLFGYLCIRNSVVGNAEPALLFFEALALGALLVRSDAAAAIALCGASLTKIEGAVFAVIAIALLGRRWKVAIPPLVTIAAWLLFAEFGGLFGTSDPRYAFSMKFIIPAATQLIAQMSFGIFFLPWIAIALVLAAGRVRASLPYLAATLVFLGFMVASYARPEAHMEWSAQRVLFTPLAIFFFSAAASSTRAEESP